MPRRLLLVVGLALIVFALARQIPPGWAGRMAIPGLLGGVQGAVGWWMVASGVTQGEGMIAVAGEASSHCVKATIEQVADNIGEEHVKKFRLLTDCMSPVVAPGIDFPAMADAFLADMSSRGMELTTGVRASPSTLRRVSRPTPPSLARP